MQKDEFMRIRDHMEGSNDHHVLVDFNTLEALVQEVALLRQAIQELKGKPQKIGRVRGKIAVKHFEEYGINSIHTLRDLRDQGIFKVGTHFFPLNANALKVTYLYDVEKCLEALKKRQSVRL
jgi:hypothetical protein